MSIRTAHTAKPLPEAITELSGQLQGGQPRLVIFFASTAYDPAAVSRQMHEAFPKACVVGCSTAGEIAGSRMLESSLVAMALDDDFVEDVAAVVTGELSGEIELRPAFGKLERHFGAPPAAWDIEKYVGLVLVDGMSGAEERLLEKLGDATDVLFVGGSAGDDLKFQRTWVYCDGEARDNAAVLVLLRLRRGYEIVKTQSFRPVGQTLIATSVDDSRRMVLEFNHKPALEAYAQALGVPVAEAPAHFFEHPLGLMVDGEPFVRSPQRAEGNCMVFYCHIREGTELELLNAADIVADTRRAVEAKKSAPGEICGLIDFNCILRTLQLRQEKRCDEYARIFAGIPTIGFATYGEAWLGHLNQTSTMLLLR